MGILLYYCSDFRYKNILLFLSGATAALTFEAKYIAGIVILLILILEIYRYFFLKKDLISSLKRTGLILAGFFAVFFGFWLFYYMHGVDYLNIFLVRLSFIDIGRFIVNALGVNLDTTYLVASSPFGNEATYGQGRRIL